MNLLQVMGQSVSRFQNLGSCTAVESPAGSQLPKPIRFCEASSPPPTDTKHLVTDPKHMVLSPLEWLLFFELTDQFCRPLSNWE